MQSVFDDADQSTLPAFAARKGIGDAFELLAPFDPTYTLPSGWTGMNPMDHTRAANDPVDDPALRAVLADARRAVRGMGHDHQEHPSDGSNNWVVGPSLSATGHVHGRQRHAPLLAEPAHLLLEPPGRAAARARRHGRAVSAGCPAIILGMNQHVAWGATVNNIDVTDVYARGRW